jgi:hypothetical protein
MACLLKIHYRAKARLLAAAPRRRKAKDVDIKR